MKEVLLEVLNDYLRLFVYKKISQCGFVDLSVSFLDSECQLVDQCSWTNLKTDDSKSSF